MLWPDQVLGIVDKDKVLLKESAAYCGVSLKVVNGASGRKQTGKGVRDLWSFTSCSVNKPHEGRT